MTPSPRLAMLAALGLPLALLGVFGRPLLALALAYDAAIVLLAAADRLAAGDPHRLELARRLPPRWIQGRRDLIRLEARWTGARRGRFLVRDLPPASFDAPGARFQISLLAGRAVELAYEAVPRERGHHEFRQLAVRSMGPFGLLQRRALLDVAERAKVYPDLVSIPAREAAIGPAPRWAIGARRARASGEGREFHQLREYTSGDDVRMIDWKAFARHARPAVREHRAERNQRILILIDAGRMMTILVGDRQRFDWAVQAAGRLARAALSYGDLVGLGVFSREVMARIAPAKGRGQIARIASLLCEARSSLDEPDLGRALGTLLRGGARRTLVVVFTELADPRAAETVVRHIGALAPRHLGLVVTLADTDLEAERALVPEGAEDAYRRVAADELWQDSLLTEKALRSRGALVARARADALAAHAVESYLEIKRRGRL